MWMTVPGLLSVRSLEQEGMPASHQLEDCSNTSGAEGPATGILWPQPRRLSEAAVVGGPVDQQWMRQFPGHESES